jgi:hypothetical protein
MPEHNLHALPSRNPHELDLRLALQGFTSNGMGWTFSSLPTRLGFLTFPRLLKLRAFSDQGYVFTSGARLRHRCA